jgi:hypothetical protein
VTKKGQIKKKRFTEFISKIIIKKRSKYKKIPGRWRYRAWAVLRRSMTSHDDRSKGGARNHFYHPNPEKTRSSKAAIRLACVHDKPNRHGGTP